MKILKFCIVFCLVAFVSSCSSDDTFSQADNGGTEYIYELEVQGGVTDYGQSTRAVTKTWSDGDVLYLRLKSNSSTISATAKYDGESWSLHIGQSLSGSGTCTAVEIENASGTATSTTVPMNAMSAVYEDLNGTWSLSGSKVCVTLNLSPTLGRVRFKGDAGREISIGGLTTYTAYNIQNGTFATSTSPLSATILQSGYTPYIYGTLINTTGPALIVDGQAMYVYGMMDAGKSGWVNCPDMFTITVKGVSYQMIAVESGTFTMGATAEQGSDAYSNETPTHQVTLSSYYIGKFEVTQELWQAVMGSNPSNNKGSKKPVEQVSWNDCQEFIIKLNSLTCQDFRLPTEAEWEYAARGGNKSMGYKYSGSNNIDDVAWYSNNSNSTTHDVGQKAPNELGLYDMSGNVSEWCSNWYDIYSSNAQTNPTGSTKGSYRVFRGGSYLKEARNCRLSNRNSSIPDGSSTYLGMRLVLSEKIPQ